MVQAEFSEYDEQPEREFRGLTDNGHIIIKCSNCFIPLVDVWVVKKTEKRQKIKALCHNCGDKSFVQDIIGEIYIGITDYSILGQSEVDIIKENNNIIYQLTIQTSKGEKQWY